MQNRTKLNEKDKGLELRPNRWSGRSTCADVGWTYTVGKRLTSTLGRINICAPSFISIRKSSQRSQTFCVCTQTLKWLCAKQNGTSTLYPSALDGLDSTGWTTINNDDTSSTAIHGALASGIAVLSSLSATFSSNDPTLFLSESWAEPSTNPCWGSELFRNSGSNLM